MKNVAIRIPENTVEEYVSQFKNVKQGIEFAAGAFLHLQKIILFSLQGVFTVEEINAMLDIVANGGSWEHSMSGRKAIYLISLEDAEKFDGTLSKWKVDITKLSKKINNLNDCQLYFWQYELFNCLYGDKITSKERNEFPKKWAKK